MAGELLLPASHQWAGLRLAGVTPAPHRGFSGFILACIGVGALALQGSLSFFLWRQQSKLFKFCQVMLQFFKMLILNKLIFTKVKFFEIWGYNSKTSSTS